MTTRVALVTGESQGIGKTVALRLARDGLDVAIADLPSKQEQLATVVTDIHATGQRAHAITCDITSEDDVKAMIESTVAAFGSLDVMVANAGILIVGPTLETKMEDFDRLMAVNTRGSFMCYKYAAEQMIKQGRGGRIIGACSISGKKGFTNMAIYCMSKFALRGLTQSCASEWAKHKITVNSYAPYWVRTDLMADPNTTRVMDLTADTHSTDTDTVAGLVSYFVRPESHFVTGQTVVMDGGILVCD